MRAVFMGTPDFAVTSLEALLNSHHEVLAVFTQADRPKNRGMKLLPPPVKVLAEQQGIPVFQPESLKDEQVLKALRGLCPDIIVVTAYGKLLPPAVLSLPKYGCVNVHASLLPKYRGASPIQAAILNGEEETGVTIMRMDKGLDTGDMLLSMSLALTPQDTYGSLHERLKALSKSALLSALEKIESQTAVFQQQDDSLFSYAPLIRPQDAFVSFQDVTVERAHRMIRAYDPAPGAYGMLGETKIKLFSPDVQSDGARCEKGAIAYVDQAGVCIGCVGGALIVKEVQGDGSKRMRASDFFRGRPHLLTSVFE